MVPEGTLYPKTGGSSLGWGVISPEHKALVQGAEEFIMQVPSKSNRNAESASERPSDFHIVINIIYESSE